MVQISLLTPDLTKFDVRMVSMNEYSGKQPCFDAQIANLNYL